MKKRWIPSRLVVARTRPVVRPVVRPSRFRPLAIFSLLIVTLVRVWLLRVRRRNSPIEVARLVRAMLEDLGGIWVKVGQLLGMRRDLFSAEFCDHLAVLQDHATGFDFEYVRSTIERDLGCEIPAVFSEFDERPFAAASIGQIHRAVLRKNRCAVAVKIRRPNIDRVMRGDIAFVRMIANFCRRMHIMSTFRWDDFYYEVEKTLVEELDYRFEATYIRQMRRNLKAHGIYVPRVFRRASSERVLVMEFVTGALMSDVLRLRGQEPAHLQQWLAQNDIDEVKVGRRLFLSLSRQIFEDNLFHGDLHPGNIVLLRGSRIALIDFGSVGYLERDFHTKYNQLQHAMAMGQFAKAADILLLLAPELPPIDLEPCKRDLVRFMRTWSLSAQTKGMDFSQKSVGYSYAEMGKIFVRYRIPATWTFMRINRAQFTLDTSLRELYPEMDYFRMLSVYNRQAQRRRIRQTLRIHEAAGEMIDAMGRGASLLNDAAEQSIFELEWMRKRARNIQTGHSKAAHLGIALANAALFLVLIAIGFFTCLYAYQTAGDELTLFSPELRRYLGLVPTVPREAWYLLGMIGVFGILQYLRISRRFRQPDIDTPSSMRR
ncbi:MAG: AarF/ABC1/UbiB kinase family protein [Myxococcales bacterium]|nr:AarF/ABC1/UbiB kinase family protein [Myxococcales bacterium]